jgi:hypothetical protein
MIIGGANDLEDGIKGLQQLKTYAPDRYSGTWYLAMIGGECFAFRSIKPLERRAREAGADRLD